MKKTKLFLLATILVMAFTMSACASSTGSVMAVMPDSGTINGIDYSIYQCEPAKYQYEILEKGGFYVDAYEQLDSPAFVFISIGKTASKDIALNVSKLDIDDQNNVSITVFETKGDTEIKTQYPTVCVELYPMPINSITVKDVDGNVLNEIVKNINYDTFVSAPKMDFTDEIE